jgi:hypothetical protein
VGLQATVSLHFCHIIRFRELNPVFTTLLGDNYYKVVSDDTCVSVAYQHAITLSQFYSWNPAVGSNCQILLAGYYVCVGVSGMHPYPHLTKSILVQKVEQFAEAIIKKP